MLLIIVLKLIVILGNVNNVHKDIIWRGLRESVDRLVICVGLGISIQDSVLAVIRGIALLEGSVCYSTTKEHQQEHPHPQDHPRVHLLAPPAHLLAHHHLAVPLPLQVWPTAPTLILRLVYVNNVTIGTIWSKDSVPRSVINAEHGTITMDGVLDVTMDINLTMDSVLYIINKAAHRVEAAAHHLHLLPALVHHHLLHLLAVGVGLLM